MLPNTWPHAEHAPGNACRACKEQGMPMSALSSQQQVAEVYQGQKSQVWQRTRLLAQACSL